MNQITDNVDELIFFRDKARNDKDWKKSDELRDYLDNKLVFVFDTKSGQEVYHLNENFFKFKNKKLITLAMNNRQYVELQIKKGIASDNNFNAWLYSINKK